MSKYLTYAEELEARGKAEGKAEAVLAAYDTLWSIADVARMVKMSEDEVRNIIEEYRLD